MKRIRSIVLVAASLLAGCATGPAFQASEAAPRDRAQLYVYRQARMIGGGNVHQIKIDSAGEALRLPNGSWQRLVLPPGNYSVSITDFLGVMRCDPSASVQLQAGQTTYVENVVDMRGYLPIGTVGLTNIGCVTVVRSEAQALKDMAGLRGAQ